MPLQDDEDVVRIRFFGVTVAARPTVPAGLTRVRRVGTVVLDAIIHRDGTIGDITLKSATNDSFAQAAVEAVKQWRYSPVPYEDVVTVTVNFSLPH